MYHNKKINWSTNNTHTVRYFTVKSLFYYYAAYINGRLFMSIRTFSRNNGLSIAMFGIFFASLIGMSVVGWHNENNDLEEHAQPTQSYATYIVSGDFVEAVFENWESEFLQMWALVILTVLLYQKGSDESKPLRGSAEQDTSSRYSIIGANSWSKKKRAIKHTVYSHSLGMALLGLFILSFSLHAVGGTAAHNADAALHHQTGVGVIEYVGTSQFWFESLQNWQSEFLAVGSLLVLSIKLRERGSPESKPVGKKYDHQTGA